MKMLLKNIFVNSISLFLLSQVFEGVKITGGWQIYIVGGLALTLMLMILKPILNIITLPLRFMTFGLFSFVINAFIFYLLTILISQISIAPFVFNGFSYAGFIIPKISFNLFFAYLVSSLLFSFISLLINWVIKR